LLRPPRTTVEGGREEGRRSHTPEEEQVECEEEGGGE
jgi:hypothetical protein